MVKLRRELSHRELPDGKLPAPAISVGFGVAAHWRLGKRGDGAAGIDSWQRIVKQRYLVSPSRFETPRSVPVTGGRAVAIFQLFDGSRGRSVFIQLDENLALIVLLVTGPSLRTAPSPASQAQLPKESLR